jgi:DNA topoisomerase-1
MRTDSTILSGTAIKAAEEFIKKQYGEKYWQVRQYKTKNESAQEAHEAIRPTEFSRLAAVLQPFFEHVAKAFVTVNYKNIRFCHSCP